MPLAIGKVTVDVSLCGAIPQGHRCFPRVSVSGGSTPCPSKHQTLPDVLSAELNSFQSCLSGKVVCLSVSNLKPQTVSTLMQDRSKSSPTAVVARSDWLPPAPFILDSVTIQEPFFSETSSEQSINMPSRHISSMLEPPLWAVPARGDSRLEPVCEAIGSHSTVDLTSRPFLRIGRSPNSDVQLLHQTSSRRHALIFHHPNGSCYVVDSASSHGTYVNGVRVRSTPSSGMVIPHRVRRGSLIRFGGPGAPTFVLKSLSVGFSAMVKEVDEPAPIPSSVPIPRNDGIFRVSTRVNLAPCGIEGGILKKRSFDEIVSLEPESKRQRCVSPTIEQQEPIQLVSPDSTRKSRRVTFHEEPQAFYSGLVADEPSSDEEELKS